MKRVLLGTFAVLTVLSLGITLGAQPAQYADLKESTTIKVGPAGGGGGACVVTEAPGQLGTKWGDIVTVVVLGECGASDKTIGQFRLISPLSAATPPTPLKEAPTVRRLAPDVVVIEARIIEAPPKAAAHVTYSYELLVGGKPLQHRAADGGQAADAERSPFLLTICPMWPCQR